MFSREDVWRDLQRAGGHIQALSGKMEPDEAWRLYILSMNVADFAYRAYFKAKTAKRNPPAKRKAKRK